VGTWPARFVSAFAIAVLAGSPALAAACELSCAAPPAAAGSAHGHDHEAAADAGHAAHAHHHAASAVDRSAPTDAVLHSASSRCCCREVAALRPIAPQSRAAVPLLATRALPIELQLNTAPAAWRHAHGPPAGSTRFGGHHLVLRI
jgi:hypothetical protein